MTKAKLVIQSDPIKNIAHLKKALQTKIVKKAIKEHLQPVVNAMKSNVPVLTGALRQSIGTQITGRKGKFAGKVGPKKSYKKGTRSPAIYAAAVNARQPFVATTANQVQSRYFSGVSQSIAEQIKGEMPK